MLALTGGACDLYIGEEEVDSAFNDARPPADALLLDGGRDGGNAMAWPDAPARANQQIAGGGWVDVGPADWSCLGLPRDLVNTEPVVVSGRVYDWATRQSMSQQAIIALPSPDVGPPLGETLSATTLDALYSATFDPLPAGNTRYGFRLAATSVAQPVNFTYEHYLPPAASHTLDLPVVSLALAESLPKFLGESRNPARAMVIGDVVDCQRRPVSNAMVAVSTVFDRMMPASIEIVTFSAETPSVPFAKFLPTRSDGRFGIWTFPAEVALFVQVWGFRNEQELFAGDLTRLATVRLQLPSNSVTTMVLEPRQDP